MAKRKLEEPTTPVDEEKPALKGFRRFFSGAERRV